MSNLEEVEMVVQGGSLEVVLQHDDVRMVKDLVWMLGLESMDGGEREKAWNIIERR